MSTISRCLLSSTNYPCTLLQVKAPKGKPHTPHVVQDVWNKKDGLLKYKKVFYVFRAFYSFPFSLPPELPLVVCYAFCAFLAFCAFRTVAPVFASGVASMCLTCSACSTDPPRPAVDVDPR